MTDYKSIDEESKKMIDEVAKVKLYNKDYSTPRSAKNCIYKIQKKYPLMGKKKIISFIYFSYKKQLNLHKNDIVNCKICGTDTKFESFHKKGCSRCTILKNVIHGRTDDSTDFTDF